MFYDPSDGCLREFLLEGSTIENLNEDIINEDIIYVRIFLCHMVYYGQRHP
jgi:hypothetical protein